MQQSASTHCYGALTSRSGLSLPHLLPPLRQPQLARLKPGPASIPIPNTTTFNNIVPKAPSSARAAAPPQRKVSTKAPVAPTTTITPSTAAAIARLESLYKILSEEAAAAAPAPTTSSSKDNSQASALSSQLLASQAEVAFLQAALASSEHQRELLRVNLDCYKFTMADTYHRLEERDELAVSLHLRLYQQRNNQRNNRQCLDLENDPLTERDARAIVKDAYVTKLHRENEALLQDMHHMQLQLDTLSAASKHAGSMSSIAGIVHDNDNIAW